MGALALIEVLDRDGSVRHAQKVLAWPLRVGRSLDNDLVLDDPHVAGHHFTLDANDDGVYLAVGDTVNGVGVGGQRLAAGERWQAAAVPSTIVAGRSHLRLRLAEHTLAPEQPLVAARVLTQGLAVLAWLIGLNLVVLVFRTYLDTDPEPFARTVSVAVLSATAVVLGWCGGWTLLSKLFAHQGHFAWHVRVLLTATLMWEAVGLLFAWVGFSLSWPWLPGYTFVVQMAVASLALYFHLQAVEPHRPLFTRAFAASAFAVGLGLLVWGHWQRFESTRSALYQSTMFPPGTRVARPVDTDTFVERLAPLEGRLADKARQADDTDNPAQGGSDDEE
jgi:hypothetical protein